MIRILLTIGLFLFGFSSFAQTADAIKKSVKVTLGSSFEKRKSLPKPLTVINDKPVLDQQMLHLVNKKDVIDIAILNGADAEAKYGIIGKNGALLIFVKPKLKFIDLAQLLRKFMIKPTDQLLDVYVHNEKIMFKAEFFVGSNWVKSVKVMNSPTNEIKASNYIVLSK